MARERVQGDKGSWRKTGWWKSGGNLTFRLKPGVVSVWGEVHWDWWDMSPCWFPGCTELSFSMLLKISRKYRAFLWEHSAYQKHPAGWVLSSLSHGQPGSEIRIPENKTPLDKRATLKGFYFTAVRPCVLTACMLTSTGAFLPPCSQSLAVGCVCGRRLWTEETSTVQRGVRQASSTKDAFLHSSLPTEQHSPTATNSTASWRNSQAKSANWLFTEETLEPQVWEGIHTEIRDWSAPSYGFSSKSANGRAPWAFPGFKICTCQQLLLHSCLMWGLFSHLLFQNCWAGINCTERVWLDLRITQFATVKSLHIYMIKVSQQKR